MGGAPKGRSPVGAYAHNISPLHIVGKTWPNTQGNHALGMAKGVKKSVRAVWPGSRDWDSWLCAARDISSNLVSSRLVRTGINGILFDEYLSKYWSRRASEDWWSRNHCSVLSILLESRRECWFELWCRIPFRVCHKTVVHSNQMKRSVQAIITCGRSPPSSDIAVAQSLTMNPRRNISSPTNRCASTARRSGGSEGVGDVVESKWSVRIVVNASM